MRVEHFMSRPVATIGIDADLAAAAQQMWEHDCGVVVVVDAEGRVAGVLTDRDICIAAWTQGRPLHELRVTSAMAHDVATCAESESDADVLRRMGERRVRRLPVVDEELRPIGVVSLADLAQQAGDARAAPAAARRFAEAMAAVTHRRETAIAEARPARVAERTAVALA